MKIAVVGSRALSVSETDLEKHLLEATEIISGGAKGVDRCAADYARQKGIQLIEILPDYTRYGRIAPLIRNREIVNRADRVVAFWDGCSKGTLSVINYAESKGKMCEVVMLPISANKKACTNKTACTDQ